MNTNLDHLNPTAREAVKKWHRSSLAKTGTTEKDRKAAIWAVAEQLRNESSATLEYVQGVSE